MASSNVRTSSEALTNLQTDLSTLSEELHQTYNLMYDYMMKVGEFWQDRKYEEFVEDYQPKIEKCDEIATRYEDWCKKVLQPVIDRAHEAENVNVGLDGGVNSTTGTPPDTPQKQNPNPKDNSTDPNQNAQPQQSNNPPTAPMEENPVVGDEEERGRKPEKEMTTEELLKELTPEQRSAYGNLKKQYTDEYQQGMSQAEGVGVGMEMAKFRSSSSNDSDDDGPSIPFVSEAVTYSLKGVAEEKYNNRMSQLNEDLQLGVLNNRNGIFESPLPNNMTVETPMKGSNDLGTGHVSSIAPPHSGDSNHDPKMESLFYKTFPDISSDSGIAEAYLKMSPEERGNFNSEYMRLQGMRDDAVFHAQDRIKMGTEMRKGGLRSPGFYWTARGMEEAADADKNYKDGLNQLGERTLEEAGMKPRKPTTRIVPIANGCGPASGSTAGLFAQMGQAIDSHNTAKREGIPLHDAHDYHEESCNIHDKCYYSGEPKEKCDSEFQRRSPVMGRAVSNASWISGQAYEQAQKDRQLSEALRSTWEKEHPGQIFDEENYRIVPND